MIQLYYDQWMNDEWMNGWMDGWMNEWMDKWMDGWINVAIFSKLTTFD